MTANKFSLNNFSHFSLTSWIITDRVGIPLCTHASSVDKATRLVHANALLVQLNSAIKFSHSKRICHCDIRPANIVVIAESKGVFRYVLIDWGLARAPGDAAHSHLGGILYFHDDIIVQEYRIENDRQILPYRCEFDIQAVTYNALAFAFSKNSNLLPPWANEDGDKDLIESRKEFCSEHILKK